MFFYSLMLLVLLTCCGLQCHTFNTFKLQILPRKMNHSLFASNFIPTSKLLKSFMDDCRLNGEKEILKDNVKGMLGLASLRKKGVDILNNRTVPHSKDEAWRFTNLRKLFIHPFKKYDKNITSSINALATLTKDDIVSRVDKDCKESYICFVNGHFEPKLSDLKNIGNTIIIPMNEIDHFKWIQEEMLKVPNENDFARRSYGSDTLSAINLVNFNDAAILLFEENVTIHNPIQVVFYSTGKSLETNFANFPRLLVRAKYGSKAEIRQLYISDESSMSEKYVSTDSENVLSSFKDGLNISDTLLKLNRNETFSIKDTLLKYDGTNEITDDSFSKLKSVSDEKGVFIGGCTRFVLDDFANITHVHIQDISEKSRLTDVISVDLSTNSTVFGSVLTSNGQSLDLHSTILHDAPNAVSRQQQRMVIGNDGYGVFRGRIEIPSNSSGTNSDQLCRTAMFGEKVRAIVIPCLEVSASEVECTHGATFSHVDPEDLFYMASRGISLQESKKVLVQGELRETLSGVKDEKTLERVFAKLDMMSKAINNSVDALDFEYHFL